MADRYFLDCELGPGRVIVEGPEAHHLAVVCRLRPGDSLTLFNGRGEEYPAQLLEVAKRRAVVEVLAAHQPQRELSFHLEVAAPLPKGERADFLVEKLTEVGVTTFVPLRTARSVVQPREAKLERLQRLVIAASKQCGRNVLMQVRSLTAWEDYCRGNDLPERKVFAHPGGTPLGNTGDRARGDVALAVGPEGGFTEEEVTVANQVGWHAVDLGPRVLRVETAALVLAAAWACY